MVSVCHEGYSLVTHSVQGHSALSHGSFSVRISQLHSVKTNETWKMNPHPHQAHMATYPNGQGSCNSLAKQLNMESTHICSLVLAA